MPHVNNVNFPGSKFALLFLHATENTFIKQKKKKQKKNSIK